MQHRVDLELARAAAQAEPAAFAALFDDSLARVHAFVSRRTSTPEQAERISERVLERAFGALAGYDGTTPFSAWLLSIVKQELRADRSATREPVPAAISAS
jgi:DNA-directed RNA polymerase specialized sigma24 family protein